MEIRVTPESGFGEVKEYLKTKKQEEALIVRVDAGVYHEKIELVGDNISLIGSGAENTILEYDDYGMFFVESEGVKLGTFRSYTLFARGDNFVISDLTIANRAGYGTKIGQAVALYMEGDNARISRCRLLGRQDTLFTGPLPPAVIEAGGFRGPMEFEPRRNQTHSYTNCYIEGDVDFIFGGATAYFTECEIRSLRRENVPEGEIQGYVTAASTPEGVETGYVFDSCRFTSDCPKGSVFLGRPWRNFAKVQIKNSELGEHIHPLGWHDWNKAEARETVTYREENNSGPGADISGRAEWAR